MSVRKTPAGRYEVRWREASRNRSKLFDRKRDAERWDGEVRRRRQLGELAGTDGRQTLDEFAAEWWELHVRPNLSPATQDVYRRMWAVHIYPRLGGTRLRDLTPEACQRFAADLAAAGIGPAARRKTLTLLRQVLNRAVEWNRIARNPAATVRLPSAARRRAVHALPPASVEAIRAAMTPRDAALVSVLAYVGTRPSEALRLRWQDVGERSLTIHATKTGRRVRAARLMAPVRSDLVEWRMASGRPPDPTLVFPRPDGREWTEDDWRNWRTRAFTPASRAARIDFPLRPYDLRHAAASLWLHEGRSVVEVAAWLGHAPSMTLDTYAHVMAEVADIGERPSAEVTIREARGEQVPRGYVAAAAEPAP